MRAACHGWSRRAIRAALLSVGLLATTTATATARPLTLGFTDPVFMDNAAAPEWLGRVVDSGASIVRLDMGWSSLAPTEPADGASPDDPAYRWTRLDTAVKQAAARGLRIVITVERAPRWAEGADRPSAAPFGAWKPDPAAFGALGQALASRYDGTYPDPAAAGATLPKVAYFQAWNEPNLTLHYAPQWVSDDGRAVRYSPVAYRRLLNAFYDGVNVVRPDASVVAAGLAPFGDPVTGGQRMPPAAFWREVFCFANTALKPTPCPDPARFDVFDHHPYSVGYPYRKALNPDDVTIPDLAKLTKPLRRAEATGRALPRKRHRLWASEVSWDSNPPDPDGVPEQTRAIWIPQMFELLWDQGVDTVLWFLVRDMAPQPSYAATYQSGMYLFDGTPKLGQGAFRFPVSRHYRRNRAIVWSRFPAAGTILVERRAGSSWRVIASQHGAPGDVVDRSFRISRSAKLRVRFEPS